MIMITPRLCAQHLGQFLHSVGLLTDHLLKISFLLCLFLRIDRGLLSEIPVFAFGLFQQRNGRRISLGQYGALVCAPEQIARIAFFLQ